MTLKMLRFNTHKLQVQFPKYTGADSRIFRFSQNDGNCLKTEFVKADPVQINYRDYRIFNVASFNEDLKKRIEYSQ